MKKHKSNKQNDILFILIASFVVVVAWIGFSIYHIHVTTTISEHIQSQLVPIAGTFDAKTIQSLKTREDINPIFGAQAIASQSAPVQQTQTQTQNQTQSQNQSQNTGTISPTPQQPTPLVTLNQQQKARFAPTNTPIGRQGQ